MKNLVNYMDKALECRKLAMDFLVKSLNTSSQKLRERYEGDSKWYNEKANEYSRLADNEMYLAGIR